MSSDDEPWKDFETLYKLRQEKDTQKEIAEELGTTSGTISYWLDKMPDNYHPHKLGGKCNYWSVCHNITPGQQNDLCDTCLALLRHAGYDGSDAPMEKLYKKHDAFVVSHQRRKHKQQPDDE